MPSARPVTDHYREHVETCQRRWEAALSAEGYDAAVIHAGTQLVAFLDDYHYPFHPNPHFLSWLPLTRHDESALIIRPGQRPLLVYYQPDDYWYLPPSDPEAWWADHFEVLPAREPGAWVGQLPAGRVALLGDAPALDGMGNLNPARLINRLHLGRTRKTPYEVACMAEASRVAAGAHLAAETAFREGCSEFEIHLRYCKEASLTDDQLPYGNIVALNQNGAVLHYQERRRERPHHRHSFLIDAGATVQGYASDITRTYASEDGEFGGMIEALDALQQDLCNGMKAGVDYRDMHLSAHQGIAAILNEAGIIRVSPETAVESGLSSVFFPHGLGHFLGIQTHDVAGLIQDVAGQEIPRPEGHPFLRLTRTLEAGNVLTVEPGLYFIDSLLKAWREHGDPAVIDWDRVERLRPCGGIRIEDNVLVTDSSPRNLTREAFAAL